MRYLVIYRPESGQEGAMPDPAHMAEMMRYTEEQMKAGVLLGTEPLTTRDKGGRVRLRDGQFTVSDEQARAAGYAFLNAGSRDEVIEQVKDFLRIAGDGEVEIRQILEFDPARFAA